MKELQYKVVQWANDKGLLSDVTKDRITAQELKVLEECGEVAKALLKNNYDELVDGIGDVAVTLIILAAMNNDIIDERQRNYGYRFSKPTIFDVVMCAQENQSWAMDCLHIFAESNKLYVSDCLQVAYDVISKRTGKMIGNTFIKD